jgi:NADPH2:quinone reductase
MTLPTSALAARLVEHGQPLAVEQVELATPSADEVFVELRFAGINPVDGYAVEGKVAADGPLPRTLGAEATGFLDGAPVLVSGEGLGARRDGVFATAATVPRSAIHPLPQGVPLDAAAGLGIVGLTTWRVVELADVRADDRVLVLGASGGVGQSVVSYATSIGAQVWGQTGSRDKADAIIAAGANEAVVTDAAGLIDAVRDFGPTVVIDPLGADFTSSALLALAPRGRHVLFGTSAGAEAKIQLRQLYRRQIQLRTYAGLSATGEERREGLTRAIEEFAAGRLRITVGRRVPLASVNDAFAALRDREVIGKVILDLG